MGKIKAIFTIPELRQKILFTLLLLAIYRIGYSIPLHQFVDQRQAFKGIGGGGTLAGATSSISSPCSAAAISARR